jgi:hypothetical protein
MNFRLAMLIIIEELLTIVKSMAKGKFVALDGMVLEFYSFF